MSISTSDCEIWDSCKVRLCDDCEYREFWRKNTKLQTVCSNCGKPISNGEIYCEECKKIDDLMWRG